MQNVEETQSSDQVEDVKTVEVDEASQTHSSSPEIEQAQVLAHIQQNFMELSASEEEVSEVRLKCQIHGKSLGARIALHRVEGHL